MITLQADNRSLTLTSKYSYLEQNISSGITTFNILNATDVDFAANAFILIGNIGAEDAEILKISSVNNSTGEIITTTSTLFAHSESTKVSIIPYDKVRFFHTTSTTFAFTTPLTGFLSVQPSDWFTSHGDESYSTGYGWYCFYNSVTDTYSQPSNAIPYSGFESSTTENILEDFFSMLNNKDLKLVSRADALTWASEAYGKMRNKLNLTNVEYTASALSTISIVSGTIEYDLEDDFDHLISIMSGLDASSPGSTGLDKKNIEFIPLRLAYSYTGTDTRYYIRGNKIGFLPTPSASATYHYMYLKRASRLNLNTDEVLLPNGGEYVIKDYMLYRAFQKFQNPQYKVHFEAFTNGLNDMVVAAVKRDANLDRWDIERSANV